MKITKGRLREIIKEELINEVSGRIPMATSGGSGFRSPGMSAAPASEPTMGPVTVEIPIDTIQELYGMVKAEHDISKADAETPERVIKSLSVIAGTLAGLL